MQRRHFLLGLGAAGLAGAAWLKPSDNGAPYSPYFAALNKQLQQLGEGRPQLVIDLDLLDSNIQALQQVLKPGATLRLVEKSLPSPDLLAYVMNKLDSRALMSFHWPFLRQSAERFGDSNILLGKPMPAAACARFYATALRSQFNPAEQLTWLIDTPARLAEYAQIAKAQQTRLRIALEVDVGLHRGGIASLTELPAFIALFKQHPEHLQLCGLMGYDAHVGKIPAVLESREQSYAKACDFYQQVLSALHTEMPELQNQPLLLNGAGSPTIALHRDNSPCNDLSAGSCLVKPSDFDLDTLSGFQPAAFIASPILKSLDGTQIPGIEGLSGTMRSWNPNLARAHFIYGGQWLAEPWAPQGVRSNGLYGHSSNQMLYTAAASCQLAVNDHLFLRPRQSEALFLQFGDLLAVRGSELVARWPVLTERG